MRRSWEWQTEEWGVLDDNIPRERRGGSGGGGEFWAAGPLLTAINPPNDFWGEIVWRGETGGAGYRVDLRAPAWQVGPHQPVTSVTNWLILYCPGELELGILGRLSPDWPRESGKSDRIPSQHCNSNTFLTFTPVFTLLLSSQHTVSPL